VLQHGPHEVVARGARQQVAHAHAPRLPDAVRARLCLRQDLPAPVYYHLDSCSRCRDQICFIDNKLIGEELDGRVVSALGVRSRKLGTGLEGHS
jgi:hypothetical protein